MMLEAMAVLRATQARSMIGGDSGAQGVSLGATQRGVLAGRCRADPADDSVGQTVGMPPVRLPTGGYRRRGNCRGGGRGGLGGPGARLRPQTGGGAGQTLKV